MPCEYCDEGTTREARISVQQKPAREVGSCNFCNRQIGEHGTRHNAMVRVVQSDMPGGIQVRFCEVCWSQLAPRTTR